jgi:8-oxo-dGTP pyrophosphatase MutT (NUDIX family)
MELLKEIVRVPGMHTTGSVIHREAVRGIIIRGNFVLMIHSTKNRDYKFPGGGVLSGETKRQALRREVREECGALVVKIGPAFGKVVEYDIPSEPEYDIFKMTSYYFHCQVESVFLEQKLDQYEYELGYQPAWINIDKAIQCNCDIANATHFEEKPSAAKELRWLARETFVMKEIRKRLFP